MPHRGLIEKTLGDSRLIPACLWPSVLIIKELVANLVSFFTKKYQKHTIVYYIYMHMHMHLAQLN